jgi:hypothetical protein
MAIPREAENALLFVAVLAADATALATARDALERGFGPPAKATAPLPFTFTEYYRDELGPEPVRAFFGYDAPFPPSSLAKLKICTNALETELAATVGGPWLRPVNLDPGYIAPDKIVLASAKNFSHRIYLGHGIYAEVTLQYIGGRFTSLPWTFPDYASGAYFPFFREMREILMQARKNRLLGF